MAVSLTCWALQDFYNAIIATWLAFTSLAQAQPQKCVISSVTVALIGAEYALIGGPDNTVTSMKDSAKDCFKEAVAMTRQDPVSSGYGDVLAPMEAPIPVGVTPEKDLPPAKMIKTNWTKLYQWNFHDGYIIDSKGVVGKNTVSCLKNKMPAKFVGNQTYYDDCNRFKW